MSLEKYGLNKPKQVCEACYEPINPDYKEAIRKGISYNERINCLGCKKSVCVGCSYEYDGQLYCDKCGTEIDKGCC